jgi:hypothetical protein
MFVQSGWPKNERPCMHEGVILRASDRSLWGVDLPLTIVRRIRRVYAPLRSRMRL